MINTKFLLILIFLIRFGIALDNVDYLGQVDEKSRLSSYKEMNYL